MKKSELIQRIAATTDSSKATAERCLNAFIDQVQTALANGDVVNLQGFGKFAVNHRPARTGRNPKTGEPMQLAASNVPTFKASKTFKDALNP